MERKVCQSHVEAVRDEETHKQIHTQLIRLKSARARLVLIFFRKVILLRKLMVKSALCVRDAGRRRRRTRPPLELGSKRVEKKKK